MECKEESVCAGELLKEVEEIQKLCSDKLQNNMVSETIAEYVLRKECIFCCLFLM